MSLKGPDGYPQGMTLEQYQAAAHSFCLISEFEAWAARETLRVFITRLPYGKDAWTVKLMSAGECQMAQASGESLQTCINRAVAAYNLLVA